MCLSQSDLTNRMIEAVSLNIYAVGLYIFTKQAFSDGFCSLHVLAL